MSTCTTHAHLAIGVADQNHLLHQFAVRQCFRHNLPEDEQQLLDGVVLQRQHKADHRHQDPRDLLPSQNGVDAFLQSLSLGSDVATF